MQVADRTVDLRQVVGLVGMSAAGRVRVLVDGAHHHRRLGVAQGGKQRRVLGRLRRTIDDEIETDRRRPGRIHRLDQIGQQLAVGRREIGIGLERLLGDVDQGDALVLRVGMLRPAGRPVVGRPVLRPVRQMQERSEQQKARGNGDDEQNGLAVRWRLRGPGEPVAGLCETASEHVRVPCTRAALMRAEAGPASADAPMQARGVIFPRPAFAIGLLAVIE